eukprot:4296422-Alexandrium_andersonii.AAC.1
MPANSASPELSAIVFCVVDQCLTVCPPARRPLRTWSAWCADPGPQDEIPSEPQEGRPIRR